MNRFLVLLLTAFLVLCSEAYAIPVFYSLQGTATAVNQNGPPLSGDITGTMIIDSEPANLYTNGQYNSLEWVVSSISIVSNVFQFYGGGYFHLTGYNPSLININEPRITGYGVTPFGQGDIWIDDGVANLFFNEDGTPYEDAFAAYSTGLPYMIAPYSGGWRFLDTNYNTFAVVGNFSAIRSTVAAPVPEPSTMLLIGTGLIGLAGWGRKRSKRKLPT